MKSQRQKTDSHFSKFSLIPHSILALALIYVLGCQPTQEQSKQNDRTPTGAAESQAETTSEPPLQTTQGKPTNSDEAAVTDKSAMPDESNFVVPGINFDPPADDAAADGWQTEELSSAAAKQLQEIATHFDPSTESTKTKTPIGEIVTPNVVFHSFRPSEMETVFSDAAFVVRRNKNRGQPAENAPERLTGAEHFREQATRLLGFANNVHNVKTKVKVFKVEQREATFTTSAYMQTWAQSDEGKLQSNATWDCIWKIGTNDLTLEKLVIRDHLEVVGTNVNGSGPMFADCTEAVLGKTPAFREQLIPGMDQWLHTIEIQYQINIGGWEGISISDVNGDGRDDLYVSQPGGLPNRLFIQNADGTCRDASAESGTDWLNQAHAAVFGDLDNDGDQDLIIGVQDGLLVMSNNGKGKFRVRRGLILPAAVPYSLTLAD